MVQYKKYVNLDLIQKYVKKNRVQELKIKREVNSVHLLFFFLFIIGFGLLIVFYKYLEKRDRMMKEKEEERVNKESQKKKENDLPIKESGLHAFQIRNAVIQPEMREK